MGGPASAYSGEALSRHLPECSSRVRPLKKSEGERPRETATRRARAMSQDEGEPERLQTLVDGRSLGTNRHWSPAIASDVSPNASLADRETSELAGTSAVELVGLEPTTSCMP